MRLFGRPTLVGIALVTLLISCVATPNRTNSPSAASPANSSESAGPKRIVMAIAGDLPILDNKMIRSVLAYSAPGGSELQDLITDGLADLDDQSLLTPKLAEAVPSLENGLWKTLPDGRMETTWKIR